MDSSSRREAEFRFSENIPVTPLLIDVPPKVLTVEGRAPRTPATAELIDHLSAESRACQATQFRFRDDPI